MSRLLLGSLLSLTLFAGCTVAHADRAAPVFRPLVPIAVAPEAVRSPYQVEILAEDGGDLDTFFHRGRYYVHGAAGQRYTVRVTNPTARRVEAVISIDGLDVIDGEAGDLGKRGYVVPPYGSLDIEGWRTSLTDVSAFRFSSVGGSYAARKSKARNVGVIAVALFAEQAAPEIILDRRAVPTEYDYDDDGGYGPEVERFLEHRAPGATSAAPTRERGDAVKSTSIDRQEARAVPVAPPPPAPRVAPSSPTADSTAAGADDGGESAGGYRDAPSTGYGRAAGATRGSASVTAGAIAPRSYDEESDCCADAPAKPERLGLGTEFGESRYSAANYTRFVRASDRPVAVAELRYNDTAGLRALGILLDPTPDADELYTRETANPFPGDRGFARPPAGVR
jgi:hypothetical protein